MRKVIFPIIALALLLTQAPPPSPSRALENWCHWPSFRKNPEATGFCSVECGPKGRELSTLWRYDSIGQITTTPIFSNGRVYFGGEDYRLHCVDAENGREIWSFQTKKDITSTPLFVEDRIYFGSDDHFFYALDANGNKLWDFKSIDKFKSSPAYWNSRIIVGGVDGWIYCFNELDGQIAWKFETQAPVSGSPSIYQDIVYCGSEDQNLYALDAYSGRLLWKFKTLKAIDTVPACFQERLYLGSDTLYCLEPKTGKKYWSANVKGEGVTSAAVIGTTVVFGTTDRRVYCLRTTDGKKVWEYETEGGCITPSICGERVYVPTNEGTLYLLDLMTANVIWTFKAPSGINVPVAIADKKVLVGCSDNTVYCFGDVLDENCVDTKEGAVDFGSIDMGETAKAFLTVRNCGLSEQKVKIRPSERWFDVSLDEVKLKAAKDTTIEVYTIPGQITTPGTRRGKLILDFDSGSSVVTVRAYVKPEHVFPSCDHSSYRYGGSRQGFAGEGCGPVEPKLKVAWSKTTLGPIGSVPCVVGNKMYFGSWDNKVYCLDTTSGKEIWQFDATGDVDATPTYFESRIYFGGWDGKFFCLDAETGTKKWVYDVRNAVIGSAVVESGKVYFGTENGTAICLDAVDGSLIWEKYVSKSFPSTPMFDSGKLYFGSKDGYVYALDMTTGGTIWSFKTGDEVIATPMGWENKIFFGSTDKRFYCLTQDRGLREWDYETDAKLVGSPALWKDKIYFISKIGKVYCLDRKGLEAWVVDIKSPCSTAPTIADGIIYICTEDGILWSLKADTGEVIWSQKTTSKFAVSPAIANSLVFCGGFDNNMYCFTAAIDCLDVSPPMLDFYSVDRWSKDQRVLQLKNCGENDLDLTITTEAKWFKLTPNRFLLEPHQKLRLVVDLVSSQIVDQGASLHGIISIDYTKAKVEVPVRCFIKTDKTKSKCEWTSFGGNPERTSETEEGCGPKTSNLKTLWEFKTRFPICSSSASSNGKLYFGSYDSSLYCVDAFSGAKVWEYSTNGYIFSTPCVAFGKVYFGSGDRVLRCLDSETGEELWTYRAFGKIDSSPLATDGKLFFGSDDDVLYCVDAYTGKTRWTYHVTRPIKGTPAVSGSRIVFSSNNGYLYCLDTNSGKELWKLRAGGNFSSPCIKGNRVFIGARDNDIYAINIETGKILWHQQTVSSYSSPAMMGNRVVIGSDDGNLYCINVETGKTAWTAKLTGMLSSPAVCGNRVFIASSDGTLYIVDDSGAVKGKAVFSASIFGSPSIADGHVYIGAFTGRMYCLGSEE